MQSFYLKQIDTHLLPMLNKMGREELIMYAIGLAKDIAVIYSVEEAKAVRSKNLGRNFSSRVVSICEKRMKQWEK